MSYEAEKVSRFFPQTLVVIMILVLSALTKEKPDNFL